MKTLDQGEARTPIARGTSAVTISTDGSYYLTGNLTISGGSGIIVNATNVTIDLNGGQCSRGGHCAREHR